jgi:hypothetical protein
MRWRRGLLRSWVVLSVLSRMRYVIALAALLLAGRN